MSRDAEIAMMGITDIESYELRYEVVEEATQMLREGRAAVQQNAEYLMGLATE